MSQIVYHIITTIKNTDKSQIHLAMMEGQEEPVIIKRLKTANSEVYKVLSGIENEHIPKIYAWEWQEDELVVAEEYVDGETLEYYLTQGLLTEEQKLKVALQLCEAVEVLHNCTPQIIHRDIKPSNVLITGDKVLKLIDFDASRQYKKLSESSDTRILGTAEYAAPEQFGYKQTDVRSDIYSMGIVFEMLNFRGKGPAMLAWKRMQDTCTNFDPKKRYKNISALAKSIRRVMRLQKYQWYGTVGIFCLALVIGISMGWLVKPMEEGEKQPDAQVQSVTPEVQVTDTSTPEPMIYDGTVEDQANVIKQRLEEESLYVEEYFKGEMNVDYFLYSDSFEKESELVGATLMNMLTEESINLENDYKFENSIFILDADYMQTLEASCYELCVGFKDSSITTYIRVYSENEPLREDEFVLKTNWISYCYEQYDTLHIIVSPNTRAKIVGFYTEKGILVEPDEYRILYDGKVAELSSSLLEQCKNQKETLFEVEFDNGKREKLTIENPYLQ